MYPACELRQHTSSKQDAELDDEAQLHAKFKRRCVYFLLRHWSETECIISSLTSDRFERSAFDVLMSLAVEKVLPKAPCSGKSNSHTAFDRLMADLIEHL